MLKKCLIQHLIVLISTFWCHFSLSKTNPFRAVVHDFPEKASQNMSFDFMTDSNPITQMNPPCSFDSAFSKNHINPIWQECFFFFVSTSSTGPCLFPRVSVQLSLSLSLLCLRISISWHKTYTGMLMRWQSDNTCVKSWRHSPRKLTRTVTEGGGWFWQRMHVSYRRSWSSRDQPCWLLAMTWHFLLSDCEVDVLCFFVKCLSRWMDCCRIPKSVLSTVWIVVALIHKPLSRHQGRP